MNVFRRNSTARLRASDRAIGKKTVKRYAVYTYNANAWRVLKRNEYNSIFSIQNGTRNCVGFTMDACCFVCIRNRKFRSRRSAPSRVHYSAVAVCFEASRIHFGTVQKLFFVIFFFSFSKASKSAGGYSGRPPARVHYAQWSPRRYRAASFRARIVRDYCNSAVWAHAAQLRLAGQNSRAWVKRVGRLNVVGFVCFIIQL